MVNDAPPALSMRLMLRLVLILRTEDTRAAQRDHYLLLILGPLAALDQIGAAHLTITALIETVEDKVDEHLEAIDKRFRRLLLGLPIEGLRLILLWLA